MRKITLFYALFLTVSLSAAPVFAKKGGGGGGRAAKAPQQRPAKQPKQNRAPKEGRHNNGVHPPKKGMPGGGNRKENQANFQKQHPRRTQVLQRGDRQTDHVDKALDHDKVSRGEATHMRVEEHKIRQEEERDAKANGGRITKDEQAHLNREENHVGRELKRDEAGDAGKAARHPEDNAAFEKNHPRRTEVLKREDNQVARVNHAETDKNLTYQQGSKIKAEENGIRRQEQAEAKANGGYITKGEQQQLNREENKVGREINRDEAKDAQ
jgi:hypothetical protein